MWYGRQWFPLCFVVNSRKTMNEVLFVALFLILERNRFEIPMKMTQKNLFYLNIICFITSLVLVLIECRMVFYVPNQSSQELSHAIV